MSSSETDPKTVRTGSLHLLGDTPDDPWTRSDRTFVDRGQLGQGGAGSVRRVLDPRLLRETALKHVRADQVHPSVLAAFVGEVRIGGQLEHPNVVPVYEVGPDGAGGLYASLKLVEGETLEERIEALGEDRLDPDALAELVRVIGRACDALAHAHSLGVVHCDLKPSNLLLGRFGEVYVADWGTALVSEDSVLATRTGSDTDSGPIVMGGTPAYLSPEQAIGDPVGVSPRTDVFGIGAILYALLTGEPPYGGVPTPEAVFKAVTCDFQPIRDRVGQRAPPRLVAICERALQRDPLDRYPDVVALQSELEQFLRGTWAMPNRSYRAGQIVVAEGDEGDCAWIVQRGTLTVWTERDGHRLQLRELGPGDVFGEMAVLGTGVRSATVEAVTDVVLLEVSRQEMQDGLGLNSWLGTFVTNLAGRFREVDARLREARISQLPDSPKLEE